MSKNGHQGHGAEGRSKSWASRRWLLGVALGALGGLLAGCRPGLGAQLPSDDFVHTFVQRDLQAVRAMSTPSFRRAVWDRVGPEEFPAIAALMGHRSGARQVDTRFGDDRAVIQMRTPARKQYELRMLFLEPDWYVDDVGREVEPAVYVSQRRQAEAVLAVRDFCRALGAGQASGLAAATSRGFASEVWGRADASAMAEWAPVVGVMRASCAAEAGPVYEASEGSAAVDVGPAGAATTYYFVPEGGMLMVDDVRLPEGAPTLRVRLRQQVGQQR